MFRATGKVHGLSLTAKLSMLVLVSVTLIFLAAFEYAYYVSRQIVLDNVEQNMRGLTQATAAHITGILSPIEKVANYVSLDIEKHPPALNAFDGFVSQIVNTDTSIFGAAVTFEPNTFDPASVNFAPYAYRDSGQIKEMYLKYAYHALDWYTLPKNLGHPLWSEPYFDEGGGEIVMTTYSSPFYRVQDGRRVFWGVNTIDISLDWLVETIKKISLYKDGYAFIISKNGVYIAHPNPELVMRESIFSMAEAEGNESARQAGKCMVRGESGFVSVTGPKDKKPSWLYFAPLASTGWSLGIIVPDSTLFADITSLRHQVFVIVGVCLCLLFLVIIALSSRITKPLRLLSDVTSEIARGNLDIVLPLVSSGDEVGNLSRSFEDMRVALKEYIADLTRTTAAKERIESELKIARHIQMSFLPRQFPPFTDRSSFNLHALLEPAKEVGGDLYDFFMLDENHLFVSVGDVSGKGVPAALFMAVTKTLVKGVAEQDIALAELLRRVNIELCLGNDSMMFVTLFCAIVDMRTGEMQYASAGHNPPLVLRASDGPFWLEQPTGLVLGVMPDAVFEGKSVRLAPGDTLVAYTDGVTEAMTEEDDFYGEDRLLSEAEKGATMSANELAVHIFASVREFVGTAPQSDDITVLVLRYLGITED